MADVVLNFKMSTMQAVNSLKKLAKQTDKAKQAAKGFGSILGKIGKIRAPTGLMGLLSAGGFVAAVTKSVKSAFSLSEQMARVNTVLKVSGDELNGFEDQARSLSQEFGMDANDIAKSLFTIASAQFSGAEAMDLMRVGAKGAQAGFADINDVIPGLIAGMKTFGTSAEETLNAIAFANDKGIIQMNEFARSMQLAGGTAANFGLSIKDFAVSMAKMTEMGAPAEVQTTRLVAAMTTLGSIKFRKVLGVDIKKVGVTAAITALSDRIISEAKKGNADFLDIHVIRKEAKEGLLQLISDAGTPIENLKGMSTDIAAFSNNALARSENDMLDFNKAVQKVEDLFRIVGKKSGPTILKTIDEVTVALTKNKDQIALATVGVIKFIAAMGPIIKLSAGFLASSLGKGQDVKIMGRKTLEVVGVAEPGIAAEMEKQRITKSFRQNMKEWGDKRLGIDEKTVFTERLIGQIKESKAKENPMIAAQLVMLEKQLKEHKKTNFQLKH